MRNLHEHTVSVSSYICTNLIKLNKTQFKCSNEMREYFMMSMTGRMPSLTSCSSTQTQYTQVKILTRRRTLYAVEAATRLDFLFQSHMKVDLLFIFNYCFSFSDYYDNFQIQCKYFLGRKQKRINKVLKIMRES